ncbi:MAG TPA: beta-ketoacyl synthase N-terminal-like domain-containing protein [Iamia sp.]|nr:beta-ketoacyl synthase N-terminal-like domain-containing protein [Iamia sp.]
MRSADRQVVVTGIGVVGPGGVGADALWDVCADVTSRPAPHPGTIDFTPADHLPRRESRRMDRTTQMACVAAMDALASAGDVGTPGDRGGVVIASAYGGVAALAEGVLAVDHEGPAAISPVFGTVFPVSAPASAVAARAGWSGASIGLAATCASGTVAISEGARRIADGRCDIVLAGGTEAPSTPAVVAAFERLTVLCADRPRPFDVDRDGFALAEGSAVVVLEEAGRARARGATVLAVIAGAAERTDVAGVFAPSDEAAVLAACLRAAIDDAGIRPDEVAHVNAHGTGTGANDAAEAAAIVEVLGPDVPVTSVKGALGHAGGAAGAIEVATAVLSIQRRALLPTVGLETLDPAFTLDVVTGGPRPWEPGPILSASLGLGGQVAAIVVTPP